MVNNLFLTWGGGNTSWHGQEGRGRDGNIRSSRILSKDTLFEQKSVGSMGNEGREGVVEKVVEKESNANLNME